jgi:hypothetical protein
MKVLIFEKKITKQVLEFFQNITDLNVINNISGVHLNFRSKLALKNRL